MKVATVDERKPVCDASQKGLVTQVRRRQAPGCRSLRAYTNEDPVRHSRPILHDVRRGREQLLARQRILVVLGACTHIVCVWERQVRRKAEEWRDCRLQ